MSIPPIFNVQLCLYEVKQVDIIKDNKPWPSKFTLCVSPDIVMIVLMLVRIPSPRFITTKFHQNSFSG